MTQDLDRLEIIYRDAGGVAALPDDLLCYLPRHKTDSAPIERLEADRLGDQITTLVPYLLVWLQDGNWPVSSSAARFLLGVGRLLLEPVRAVLSSGDDVWKYWVLERLVAEDHALRQGVGDLLRRMAEAPTIGEREEGVDELARELLAAPGPETS